jgi:hypothetical protein
MASNATILSLEKAIDLILATPGRIGHLVDPPESTDVIIAGDLHGNLGNFNAICEYADLEQHPSRHLIFQEMVHSRFRYSNGGDASHQLLDRFVELKVKFPARVHLIMGNHELAQWRGQKILKGDDCYNELFTRGVEFAYGEDSQVMERLYQRLFSVLPLMIRFPNRLAISHSLPTEKNQANFDFGVLTLDALPDGSLDLGGTVRSLVWGREATSENAQRFLNIIDCDWLVTGHIPQETGYLWASERHLILDSMERPAGFALLSTVESLTPEAFSAGILVLEEEV